MVFRGRGDAIGGGTRWVEEVDYILDLVTKEAELPGIDRGSVQHSGGCALQGHR